MEKLNENYNVLLLSILIAGWGLGCSPFFACKFSGVSGGGGSFPLPPWLRHCSYISTHSLRSRWPYSLRVLGQYRLRAWGSEDNERVTGIFSSYSSRRGPRLTLLTFTFHTYFLLTFAGHQIRKLLVLSYILLLDIFRTIL